jgi:hypothetical protein
VACDRNIAHLRKLNLQGVLHFEYCFQYKVEGVSLAAAVGTGRENVGKSKSEPNFSGPPYGGYVPCLTCMY